MELDLELMAASFESPPLQLGHSENHLAQYIWRWFGPRLAALLKPTPGVVSVELEMGSLRDGADLFLLMHNRDVLGPVLRMPVEVKTAFGQRQRLTSRPLEAGVEAQNLYTISEASGQAFSPRHVLNGVLQTSMYAAAHSGSGNHGVLISSECLFLVRNSTHLSVDVSEAILLVGGDVHPVAAIAWYQFPLAKKLRRMDRAGSFAKYASFEGVAMQLLAEYRSGAVYRCSFAGRDTVVKTANPDKSWLVAELGNEVEAYNRLQDLQGICIPRIFSTRHSVISGEDACFIAMEFLGDPSIHYGEDTEEAHANALCALDQGIKDQFSGILRMIHRRGVAHCDIRTANLLYAQTRPGGLLTPFLIDFGLANAGNATEEQKKEDMVLLQEALSSCE
ncbi:hypothetical protein H4S06_000624 [Coemansia sp. BCRC 34490]|nr:hypothetical protein H4S06_000624 [Coemansia sp. BCRC 34490]